MAKRFLVSMVFLLVIGIVGAGLGCAAPATPTPTVAPVTPGVTPKVTPTEVAPGVKPTRMRIHSTYPIGYPTNQYAEKLKALLAERSGGKIKVDIYPSAQVFADASQYAAVGMGSIETVMLVNGTISLTHRPWEVFRYAARYIKDLKAYDAFWEEPAGGGYFKSLLEKDGVKLLGNTGGTSDLPDVVINNKRPVKKLEDWKGLKIRMAPGTEWYTGALGASVIPMSGTEALTALQTGMIDGTYTTLAAIVPQGYGPPITKYCTTYLVPAPYPIHFHLANLDWWNGLNDATRAMILKAAEDSRRWVREEFIPANDAPLFKQIQGVYGANFYHMPKEDPAEVNKWRQAIAGAIEARAKAAVTPEMFNLLETKYRY